jgi:hypothetical protein
MTAHPSMVASTVEMIIMTLSYPLLALVDDIAATDGLHVVAMQWCH